MGGGSSRPPPRWRWRMHSKLHSWVHTKECRFFTLLDWLDCIFCPCHRCHILSQLPHYSSFLPNSRVKQPFILLLKFHTRRKIEFWLLLPWVFRKIPMHFKFLILLNSVPMALKKISPASWLTAFAWNSCQMIKHFALSSNTAKSTHHPVWNTTLPFSQKPQNTNTDHFQKRRAGDFALLTGDSP